MYRDAVTSWLTKASIHLQVWFAGSHSDVGGGSRSNDKDTGLANITLSVEAPLCIRMT